MIAVIQKDRSFVVFLHMLSDGLLTLLAYFAAIRLRFSVLDGEVSIPLDRGRVLYLVLLYCAVVVFAYYCFNLYKRRRAIHRMNGVITIASVSFVCMLALVAGLFLLRIYDFSRWTLFFFWEFSVMFVVAKHELVTQLFRVYSRKNHNALHVAIVGNGHLARQFMRDQATDPYLSITVDGYISAVERPGLGERLGSYEELEQILASHPLDCLVVALEMHEIGYMRDVLVAAEKEGTRVELIPFYNDYFPSHPTIEVVGNTKMINLRSTPLDSIGWAMVKRLMDIVGSLFFIVLTSPVMLLTAVGVKLSSPGPVLFRQERVGKNKKPFMMLKFRSMRTDVDHSGWSTDADARKTRFGSIIRKLSIDELPQLFNVLIGQMSLVGPRPELPRYVHKFQEEVPLYLVRQQVRPGMTGWAQVHGLRGNTSIETRVEYDIWYIENWGLGLDIRILLKTVFGGFINREKLAPPAPRAGKKSGGSQR